MTIMEADLVRQPNDLDAGMPIDVQIDHSHNDKFRITLTDTWGGTLTMDIDRDELLYELESDLVEFVDEIAGSNPTASLGGQCYYCGEWDSTENNLKQPDDHKAFCLWRRARSL